MRKILTMFVVAVALVLLMPQPASADNAFDPMNPATLSQVTANVTLTSATLATQHNEIVLQVETTDQLVLTGAHLTRALVNDTSDIKTLPAVEVERNSNDRTVQSGMATTDDFSGYTSMTATATWSTLWRPDDLRS